MTSRTLLLALALSNSALSVAMDPSKPILARNPSLGTDRIVFEFGTDLWTVPKTGGQAHRLTDGPGVESHAHVSPDGKWVAFSGEYDGNVDVYVVPIEGGQPKRLTYHPDPDTAEGWSPDGKSILFSSAMDQLMGQNRLYTIPVTGGIPSPLPLPRGWTGAYSQDGSQIAYIPHDLWQPAWKRYHGGQTTPIWIARLSDSKVEKVPRQNSNDRMPMWVGKKVYFVSDRDGRSTLYDYDTNSKKVSQLIPPGLFDVKSASAGTDDIVVERMGSISLYNIASKKVTPVAIQISDDLPEVRNRFASVGDEISGMDLSPNGVRAVFEAHGDIFTVPVDKGTARNLTNTPGVAERIPMWSPDAKKIAFLSDENGVNYKLHVIDQMGDGKPDVYDLSDKPSWYHSMGFSPDSKKIVYVDQELNLYYLDLATKKVTKVDKEPFYTFGDSLNPSWSPDNKWITYTKRLQNKLCAVFVYSLETGKSTQITDGLSDAQSASFDRGGKYLYFLASTDVAGGISTGGMSSFGAQPTFSAYVMVLTATEPSPFAEQNDDEKVEPPAPPKTSLPLPGNPAGAAGTAPPTGQPTTKPVTPPPSPEKEAPSGPETKIDFDGIGQRILSIPVPAGSYGYLVAATPGSFFLGRADGNSLPVALKFTLATKQLTPYANGVLSLTVNAKGDKAIIRGIGGIQIASTASPVPPGAGMVRTSGLQAKIEPAAEFRQMFREIWHNDRDFFYDPNTHGLDIDKVMAKYEPFLENLGSRADFNYLLEDMINEVTVGHTFSGGGPIPRSQSVPGGLLGADYTIDNGHYKFSRIFNGENWNPGMRAPLTQPGATAKVGEYLLAVNGKDLTSSDNIYAAFEATAGRQVMIKVGPKADGTDSRSFLVTPISNEHGLRHLAWVEDNRRKVDELSKGRISYIHMPDTGGGGYTSFNRYFTAQLGKDAVLVDDRFNNGGALADYVIQVLNRQVLGHAGQRDSEDFNIPIFSNEGPKAMLINEMAGSGGDAMPLFFRESKTGPLIGMRTWGGLVAASQGVPFMGGGFATSPQLGIYGTSGEWDVENKGVGPDIEVEEDPYLWRQGRDPQLEMAVKTLLDALAKNPPKTTKRPAFPNYHKNDGLGKGS